MVRDDPKKLVYIWHRFFTMGPEGNSKLYDVGNSALYNVRNGVTINLQSSITDALIESADGFSTLPFDRSVGVSFMQDYHHPIDTFVNANTMKVKDWTDQLVHDLNYEQGINWPHQASDIAAPCGVPVRLTGPGHGFSTGISYDTPFLMTYQGIDPVTGLIINCSHNHFSSVDKSKITPRNNQIHIQKRR